jgi:hypothetical protein
MSNAAHPTPHVFFLRTPSAPERCLPGAPLLYRDVPVYRLGPEGSFDIVRWSGVGGIAYAVTAMGGHVRSVKADASPY